METHDIKIIQTDHLYCRAFVEEDLELLREIY